MAKHDLLPAGYRTIERRNFMQGFFRAEVLDSNFLPSQRYAQLRQEGVSCILGGAGLASLTACLVFYVGVPIPPVGIVLLMIMGAAMVGYGVYSMERCRLYAIAHDDYIADVEPVGPLIKTCAQSIYEAFDLT